MDMKTKIQYGAYISAVIFFAVLVELSTVYFSSEKETSLNDIETAAFARNLSKFQEFIHENNALNAEREKWLLVKENQLKTECASLSPTASEEGVSVEKMPVAILDNVAFSGSKTAPQRGSWIESYTLSSCGLSQQINIAFQINDDKKVVSMPLLNGTSLAKPFEQQDGLKQAVAASRVQRLDCSDWRVKNTTYLGAAMNATDGSWEEEWSVYGCGSNYTALMVFTPNTEFGTKIRAKRLVKNTPNTL